MNDNSLHILTIDQLRNGNYPGSELQIEKELEEKESFKCFIASYYSEGLKIYGYLMVPISSHSREGGNPINQQSHGSRIGSGMTTRFPAIIFNHGYLPLDQFQTERQYVRYMEYLAKAGYIVFKPDYRGHGNSEGESESLFESGYAVDVLNALSSLKTLPQVDIENLGIWGHSMGGDVTLKVLEVVNNLKAATIWGAPVVPYNQLAARWGNQRPNPNATEAEVKRREEQRRKTMEALGDPEKDIEKYQEVSPASNTNYINTPILLEHVKADDRVPFTDSESLYQTLKSQGKEVEIHLIDEGDHNFSGKELDEAMEKTVEFFDKYLKVSS